MIERGIDGAIANFMDDIATAARESNGFVLEIGVATGTGSTVAIQEGLENHPNPLHISVDYQQYMAVQPQVPWWFFILGDSREESTLAKVYQLCKGRPAGVIFIDTEHTYEQMKAELPLWANLADERTVWLFHDTHMFGGTNSEMIQAIAEFAEANGWVWEDWRTEAHGLGRMRRP